MIAESLYHQNIEDLKVFDPKTDAEARKFAFYMLREIAKANQPEVTAKAVALEGMA